MGKIKKNTYKLLIVSLVFCFFVLSCILLNTTKTSYAADTMLTLSSDPAGVALIGGGNHAINSDVTIKAPLKASDDKLFVRWKNTAGVEVSNSATYTFKITEPTTLIAEYAAKSYSLTVDSNDKTSKATCAPKFTADGLQLDFVATAGTDKVFDGWYYNAKLLSTDVNYSMNFGNVFLDKLKVKAKFRDASTTLIRFVRDKDITVKSEYVLYATTTIKAPMAYKSGYNFSKWVLQGGSAEYIADASINVTKDVSQVYEAVFTPIVEACSVSVIGGTANKASYNKFDRVTVTANVADFKYWSIDNKIVSYNSVYTFTIDGNVAITANAGAVSFEQTPSVYLSPNSKFISRGADFVLSPLAFVVVPKSFTVIEKGLLFVSGSNDNLILNTEGARKITSNTNTIGQFTGTYTNLDSTRTYTTRAYVIYKNTDGLYVEYSDIVNIKSLTEDFESVAVLTEGAGNSGRGNVPFAAGVSGANITLSLTENATELPFGGSGKALKISQSGAKGYNTTEFAFGNVTSGEKYELRYCAKLLSGAHPMIFQLFVGEKVITINATNFGSNVFHFTANASGAVTLKLANPNAGDYVVTLDNLAIEKYDNYRISLDGLVNMWGNTMVANTLEDGQFVAPTVQGNRKVNIQNVADLTGDDLTKALSDGINGKALCFLNEGTGYKRVEMTWTLPSELAVGKYTFSFRTSLLNGNHSRLIGICGSTKTLTTDGIQSITFEITKATKTLALTVADGLGITGSRLLMDDLSITASK